MLFGSRRRRSVDGDSRDVDGAADPRASTDVRITALEAIPFAVPYRHPAGFASGTVTTADNVLVRVHTDAGLVGQAEAQPRPYTYGETQASIVHTVRETLAALIVGLDPLRHRDDRRAVRADRGQPGRARRRRPRRLGPRGPDPRSVVPRAARRPRDGGRGRAHGVVRHAGGDGRGGARGPRAARRADVQGQGRARARRSTSRRPARSATRCPTRISMSTPTAAGATTTRCAPATS